MTPTPGPYSTITRARPKLIGSSSCLMRKRELGTIEPSMRGWRKKLRANSRHVAVCPVPRGRFSRLIVHLLSPGHCHRHSIAIFARRSHLAAGGGSAAGAGRGEASAARALSASKPSRHSSATSRSRCSPWISMRPFFTAPPAPHERFNRAASSSSCAASNVSPLTTVTPLPLRPATSRPTRTRPAASVAGPPRARGGASLAARSAVLRREKCVWASSLCYEGEATTILSRPHGLS